MEKFILRYSQVPANPTLTFARKTLARAKGSNEVISIGGGSTIDVGKYISYMLEIPHTAIPTTAGTGSEVTKFAVFIKNGTKISMEDEKLIPDNYELKPELIVSLPALHTVSSGVDALCQAIESYWSPQATQESKLHSIKAIRLIMNSLYDSYRNPDNESLRMNMLLAANYSGKAINITKTSICHAISYPLTIRYGIPHGIACAMTLPIFMEYFGMNEQSIAKVKKLFEALKIKKITMGDDVIDEALKSERAYNTPKLINKAILQRLL